MDHTSGSVSAYAWLTQANIQQPFDNDSTDCWYSKCTRYTHRCCRGAAACTGCRCWSSSRPPPAPSLWRRWRPSSPPPPAARSWVITTCVGRWRQARENSCLPVVQRDHEVEEVRLPEVGWRLLLEVRPPDAGSPEHHQRQVVSTSGYVVYESRP